MRRSDTSSQWQDEYDRLWRTVPPEQRFVQGLRLIGASRRMLIAGLRAAHPGESELAARQRLLVWVRQRALRSN